MRKALLAALAGLMGIGMSGSAGAATLDFTGTLDLHIATLPTLVVPGGGSAQLTDDGSYHLLSFFLPGGAFGPITTSLLITNSSETDSIRFTGMENLSGSFAGISGGPPGGGTMGLQGLAKLCILFAPDCGTNVPFPLTPTASGAGFGIGGTRTATGAVSLTFQDAPWTIGQPVVTIHTANSTVSTPALPGGYAHGPASQTSSTAQPSGALQLVTVSKVFTSLVSAFPELPVYAVLNVHFVPEPGGVLLLGTGIAVLAIYGRRRERR